jgi:hypothetical protein
MQVDDHAEADRREVNPPIEVETAKWSAAGTLDWCVKEQREWFGRVRGPDGLQQWIKATDLRRAKEARQLCLVERPPVQPQISRSSALKVHKQ